MSGLPEMTFIGMTIEGFFYGKILILFCSERAVSPDYMCPGFYSAIFCMYIRHRASKELDIDKRNILLYALCILYILSTAMVVGDVTGFAMAKVSKTCIDHHNFSVYTVLAGPQSRFQPSTS